MFAQTSDGYLLHYTAVCKLCYEHATYCGAHGKEKLYQWRKNHVGKHEQIPATPPFPLGSVVY